MHLSQRGRKRAAVAGLVVLAVLAAAVPGAGAGWAKAKVRARAALVSGGPPLLSAETQRTDVSSTYGSGIYGTWRADRFGLPSYRYTLDQATDPRAAQVELNGGNTAWHQIGNDTQLAFASNHGYTELWSQQRLFQWANKWQPDNRHYSGGYGYLREGGGNVLSTLWLDRPAGAATERDFGIGYFHHRTTTGSVDIDEHVYSPFGSESALLHDVTITNRTAQAASPTWFEYWDVNPVMQPAGRNRGMAAPTVDPSGIVTVNQLPDEGTFDLRAVDAEPLSIFAAPVAGPPTAGFDTDLRTFFGSAADSRARPAAVVADTASSSIAPPLPPAEYAPGSTMASFRTPVSLAPGASTTLRYVYGMAKPADVASTVAAVRGRPDPLTASEQAWADWVPQLSTPVEPWLARELQWGAYTVRSRATAEDGCPGRSLTSGSGATYDSGQQGGPRDPMQHILAAVYDNPELAKDVTRFSAAQMQAGTGLINASIHPMCLPYYLIGWSGDQYGMMLLGLTEYVLGSRDLGFLDEVLPYANAAAGVPSGSATLWDHLKLGFSFQESPAGVGMHRLPTAGTMGDWADFSVGTHQMTESMEVAGLLAFVYPRLADIADLRGDIAFAASLRTRAAELTTLMRLEWQPDLGWFTRGYRGPSPITGLELTQHPYAILAGVPDAAQSGRLVGTILRYLTGRGAPGGPSHIGTALMPAAWDMTPNASHDDTGGFSHTVASWFQMNGPLMWAYARLDGIVPGARADAWDELVRNSMANLATVHPDHWNGVTTVDDVCDVWYTAPPYQCGVFAYGNFFRTQTIYQPAAELLGVLKMAGIEPTRNGFDVAPHFPFQTFSMRYRHAGVASEPGRLRGYVSPETAGSLQMTVRVPAGTDPASVQAYAAGTAVASTVASNRVTFQLSTPGRVGGTLLPADWAVTWSPAATLPDDTVTPPGPSLPTALPVNCTAVAGTSCRFTGAPAPLVQGYVAVLDAPTSFSITDDSTGADVASASGSGVSSSITYVVGRSYTLVVQPGSGEVIAGAPY
jgi:hypothetical protein